MSAQLYYAIRKYKDTLGAPSNAPQEYPSKVVYLGHSSTLPTGLTAPTWSVLTENQLIDLKKSLKSEWDLYQSQIAAQKIVSQRIKAAMEYGKNLIAEYGAQNVVSGKTTAEVTEIAAKLASLQALLLSGSLYAALDEIERIVPDELITQKIKDEFKYKIMKYLGI